MMMNRHEYLELYVDSHLSRRIVNALFKIDIITIGQFVDYFGVQFSWKIHKLRGVGPDSREKIRTFIELLQSNWYQFNDEAPVEASSIPNLEDVILNMGLSVYSSYFSKRTVNALWKVWISTVKDLFSYADKISPNITRGLWKKWFSEILKFKRYLSQSSLDDGSPNIPKEGRLSDYINDKRLLWILSFNLLERVEQLSWYVNWQIDWKEVRFLKEEDRWILIDIFRRHEKTEDSWLSKGSSSIMDSIMVNFDEADKFLINERILWNGTLEEVGSSWWVTRERVRQKQGELERRIAVLGFSIFGKDESLYAKIAQIIRDYQFVILPKDIAVFDFLWTRSENYTMTFLMLKWLEWIRGDFLEKSRKVYVLYTENAIPNGDILRSLYGFVMYRLDRNNEDILIDDLVYEYILDNKDSFWEGGIDVVLLKQDLVSFIERISEIHKDYVLKEGVIYRLNKKHKIGQCIEAILKDNPDGLHFREIAKQIRDKYWVDFDENRVHRHLTSSSGYMFINIWLWIYTLKWTWDYSGENTTDIIYLFLKNEGSPRTIGEIQEYVLKRKRIEVTTVSAAIDYPSEFRFCTYCDWKIGLKEWWLWNVRQKKLKMLYEMTLSDAIWVLINESLIRRWERFNLNWLKEKLLARFPNNSVSTEYRSLSSAIARLVNKWVLTKEDLHSVQNDYFLN